MVRVQRLPKIAGTCIGPWDLRALVVIVACPFLQLITSWTFLIASLQGSVSAQVERLPQLPLLHMGSASGFVPLVVYHQVRRPEGPSGSPSELAWASVPNSLEIMIDSSGLHIQAFNYAQYPLPPST